MKGRSSGRWRCASWVGSTAAWLCSVAVVLGLMRLGEVQVPVALAIAAASVGLTAAAVIVAVLTRRITGWITGHLTAAAAGRMAVWIIAVALILAVMRWGGVDLPVAVAITTGGVLVAGRITSWLARSPGKTRTA